MARRWARATWCPALPFLWPWGCRSPFRRTRLWWAVLLGVCWLVSVVNQTAAVAVSPLVPFGADVLVQHVYRHLLAGRVAILPGRATAAWSWDFAGYSLLPLLRCGRSGCRPSSGPLPGRERIRALHEHPLAPGRRWLPLGAAGAGRRCFTAPAWPTASSTTTPGPWSTTRSFAIPANVARLFGPELIAAGVPDAGRPMLLATEMLDWALWGRSPAGYHLQNLIWHAAVVLLLLPRACGD